MKSPDPGASQGGANTSTDSELVRRALEGDTEAFRTLVEKYQQPLYGYAVAIICDAHEAQDVSQQALVEAYCGLAKFDLSRNFKRWIFGIARNLCFDALKKRPRETSIGVGLERFEGSATVTERRDLWLDGKRNPNIGGSTSHDSIAVGGRIDSQDDPDSSSLDGKLELLRKNVAQMPEKQRVILALRYLEGLSKAEIGRTLNLSIDAVSQRLYRSLRELRRRMGKQSNEGRR